MPVRCVYFHTHTFFAITVQLDPSDMSLPATVLDRPFGRWSALSKCCAQMNVLAVDDERRRSLGLPAHRSQTQSPSLFGLSRRPRELDDEASGLGRAV
jgi:hypothetical protein